MWVRKKYDLPLWTFKSFLCKQFVVTDRAVLKAAVWKAFVLHAHTTTFVFRLFFVSCVDGN